MGFLERWDERNQRLVDHERKEPTAFLFIDCAWRRVLIALAAIFSSANLVSGNWLSAVLSGWLAAIWTAGVLAYRRGPA
ncbi:MAG TPA: hypothetical protein VD926_02430 [Acidimicrobiales bacterium]|nr:hypothetical protein [Acidimicrobiales bacterium]